MRLVKVGGFVIKKQEDRPFFFFALLKNTHQHVFFCAFAVQQKGGAGESESKTGDATYAKPNKVQRANSTKDQLDSMLGNLQV